MPSSARPLPPSSSPPARHLVAASAASAALLSILCAMTLAGGVSQQWFERVHAPAHYAAALLEHAAWLRALVAVDDLFIAAYLTATVLLASHLNAGPRLQPLTALVVAAGAAGGVLDLLENHHLLALLRTAQAGVEIPLAEIVARSTQSQLKWMLGHVAFVWVGLQMRGSGWPARAFRATLLGYQLPLGALAWAVDQAPWAGVLAWMRYAAFIGGFAGLAWLARHGALGTDAPPFSADAPDPHATPRSAASAASGSGAPA